MSLNVSLGQCTLPDGPCLPLPAEETAVNPTSLLIAVILVILSGLFSGLNLGLMSFTADDLGVVISGSDDDAEVRNAQAILPLRQQGNLLLCSLLLGNTLVNALIAVLLESIASGVMGTICTTGLIVVFGEIIPQAVCSRNALSIGAFTLPLVYVFVVVCFPIAFPISLILDGCLGREISGDFNRKELLSLVQLNSQDPERAKKTGLTPQDGKLLGGALTFKDRKRREELKPGRRREEALGRPADASQLTRMPPPLACRHRRRRHDAAQAGLFADDGQCSRLSDVHGDPPLRPHAGARLRAGLK